MFEKKLLIIVLIVAYSLALLLGVTVIFLIVFNYPNYAPHKVMEQIYGEKFTPLSKEHISSLYNFNLYTMRSESGLICHAARGDDRGEGVPRQRTYDDYCVRQQEQTPAVQRLLSQKEFAVSYQTTLGQQTAYYDNYPYCRWVIAVEKYEDIPNALTLALDTVSAEDSKLPKSEFWRRQNWGSIPPEVQLGTEPLAIFSFHNEEGYDYDAVLNEVQLRFAKQLLQNQDVPDGGGGI